MTEVNNTAVSADLSVLDLDGLYQVLAAYESLASLLAAGNDAVAVLDSLNFLFSARLDVLKAVVS
jgi:hypothetical protein